MSDLDDRLARLERVFDSLANAWSSGSTTPTQSAGAVNTSTPFIRKLTAFADTLEPDEQKDLAMLIAAATTAAKQATRSPQTDQQQAASKFLQALDVKLTASGGMVNTGTDTELGPTITITTTATVMASHPAIGC